MVWLTNGFMLHFYITGGKVHVCRAEGCCTRSTLTVTCSKVRKKKGKPAEDMNLKSDTDAYDGPYTCYITNTKFLLEQHPGPKHPPTDMKKHLHPAQVQTVRRWAGTLWDQTTKLKSHFDILGSLRVLHVNDVPSSFTWSTDGHRNLDNIS